MIAEKPFVVIKLNEHITLKLHEDPSDEHKIAIFIHAKFGRNYDSIGLRLATLNKIQGIANGDLETIKVLYGKKDK